MTLTVTPAAEFRAVRERGVIVPLPSGRVVRMRSVRPDQLLKLGHIPDVLATLALKHMYGKLSDTEFYAFTDVRDAIPDALAVVESLRVVCTAALIEPRIVETPQADDEIAIDDLTLRDRQHIFDLAFSEVSALASFRDEPDTAVAAVPDEPGDAHAPGAAGGGA